jgi:hypothetical protein
MAHQDDQVNGLGTEDSETTDDEELRLYQACRDKFHEMQQRLQRLGPEPCQPRQDKFAITFKVWLQRQPHNAELVIDQHKAQTLK